MPPKRQSSESVGFRSRRLVTAPMMTADHRKQRREFAQKYQRWNLADWKQIVFSEDSRFEFHWMDGHCRIRRETSEKKHPAANVGRTHAGNLTTTL